MPSLECEEFVECEEFRVCVAGIETTKGNFGARTKIPIPKPAQTSRGTPVGSIFPSSPWVRPGGKIEENYSTSVDDLIFAKFDWLS